MGDIGRRTAAEAGRAIADALRNADLPHALGGALALGVAGVPRGTKDVDVNVFVEVDELHRVIDCLRALGIEIDAAGCNGSGPARRHVRRNMGRDEDRRLLAEPTVLIRSASHGGFGDSRRVDWKVPFRRGDPRLQASLLRIKDRGDLERLVAVRGEHFDHA